MKKAIGVLCIIGICFLHKAEGQSKFYIGFNAGGNVSRLSTTDSFPTYYSRRNRLGYVLGMQTAYDIKPFVSLSLAVNYVNRGFKLYNEDTGAVSRNPLVTRKFSTIAIPLGVTFRQKFSSSSAVHEKFGVVGNFYMNTTPKTTKNVSSNEQYRIKDLQFQSFHPMFYLGGGIGGNTAGGDRYEFSVVYNQSFNNQYNGVVEHGQGLIQKFPLVYRGGFLQFGISYYFNLDNFKKSNEYFID